MASCSIRMSCCISRRTQCYGNTDGQLTAFCNASSPFLVVHWTANRWSGFHQSTCVHCSHYLTQRNVAQSGPSPSALSLPSSSSSCWWLSLKSYAVSQVIPHRRQTCPGCQSSQRHGCGCGHGRSIAGRSQSRHTPDSGSGGRQ